MTPVTAATIAAALYAVGAVLLFGVRSWQQKRATGSAGFNGFAADREPAARIAGLSFAAAVIAGLASPALVLVGVLPVLNLGRAAAWVGLVLALAGFGLAVLAQQTMGRSWRIGVDLAERTDLITHGVFRYVRNPIFSAMIAAQAGTTLLAPTWLGMVGLVLLVAGVELQVRRVEEPHLLAVHGSRYADYLTATGRFLPLVRSIIQTVGRPEHQPEAAVNHSHTGPQTATGQHRRLLLLVVGITVTVVVVEVIGGLLSGSLALLADAGHMLTDSTGLIIALIATSLATRPATPARTFGLQRIEVLAALINGLLLVAVAVWVLLRAVDRWNDPADISSGLMLLVAVLGGAANAAGLLILRQGQQESLNLRGAYLEVLGDLLGSIAVVIAAIAIFLLVIPRAWSLLREVVDVLLEGTPRGVDLAEVRSHIEEVPGVVGVHDLHAWTITSGVPVLSAHVIVDAACIVQGRSGEVLDRLGECLGDHFDVDHCTFQLEPEGHQAHEAPSHS